MGAQDVTLEFAQLLISDLTTVQVQCCFTSAETIRIIRDIWQPRTSTSTFARLLSSDPTTVQVQCCFTSTETIRIIRDIWQPRTGRPPRLSHSSCSSAVLLYVHRNNTDYLGYMGAQDVLLEFAQFLISDLTTVQVQCCFTSTETIRTIWDIWEPSKSTLTFP